MLIGFVTAYLVISMGLGLYAATRVHSARDYITAGRALPLWIVTAMVFATWFGAETVLGIPATFMEEDLGGLISDPFGAALCLILFGVFFARKLYRMNLLTIGDFYRDRFDRRVEIVTGIAIALSYLGWVSAQITALGLVFNLLSDGAISTGAGIVLGAAIVLVYTLFGGMWSVALTTFFQMIVIVLGLLFIAWQVAGLTGGVAPVIDHALAADKFHFWPEANGLAWIAFLSGLLTMGFGSIPQQDVFQRANASKNEATAMWGSILGGSAYFLFAAVPLFLVYAAQLVMPDDTARLLTDDAQKILPILVEQHLPLYVQVIFYGALLSVIMSTASGTLLAPSVTLAENVIRELWPEPLNDDQLLTLTRGVVVAFSAVVALYALWSLSHATGIHQMVENAYKVTLVLAFVPLVAGLYWRRANTTGAYWAIVLGLATWIPLELWLPEGEGPLPPQFAGFLAASFGMLAGSLRQPSGRAKTTTMPTA